MAGEGLTLEYTPTWVVAVVCTIIVAISLAVERILHYAGSYLKKKKQKPLFEALLKVKEELMLLGFISLLLTVFQSRISTICIPKSFTHHWLPCKENDEAKVKQTDHFQTFFSLSFVSGSGRRLLANAPSRTGTTITHCEKLGKAPLLSTVALHHLHIFIFMLAIVHVTFCVLTILFGEAKIRQWKHWEDSIAKEVQETKITHVHQHDFIKNRYQGIGKRRGLLGWLHSFVKQFYGSVTKTDYTTLRTGFITTHCNGNPKFNFHKYMIRALEADFKIVVGISWYLWVFVVIFLLLNVQGWHTYFWISFVPFILLLAVGTKLEHVITQLAHEVAEKHIAIEGDLIVQPSDKLFWFSSPKIVLFLIHVILFQNSFELAFFFWIWVEYSFDSCIMGEIGYIIPRLFIGVIVQLLCSYSTLPLYAIVTMMGSSFKKAIFKEDIQQGLLGWAHKAKMKKVKRAAVNGFSQVGSTDGSSTVGIQMKKVEVEPKESAMKEEKAEEIVEPSTIPEEP